MSTDHQADVAGSGSIGEYEVVDLGRGRLDDAGPPGETGLLEIDLVAQPATDGARPHRTQVQRRAVLCSPLFWCSPSVS